MISLFERFDVNSKALYHSLKFAEVNALTVVLEDDGFLNRDIISPYQFFSDTPRESGHGLYFNQLPVPEYVEIEGNNNAAFVKDMGRIVANIHFKQDVGMRIISHVDWIKDNGQVYVTEYYHQLGFKYCEVDYDEHQRPAVRRYFNAQGQEVILEQLLTNDCILNWQGKTYMFDSKLNFYAFFMHALNGANEKFIINTLAMPLSILLKLESNHEAIVFFQETIGEALPGNMTYILEQQTKRKFKVVIPDEATFEQAKRIASPLAQASIVQSGYLYRYQQPPKHVKEAVILTNSDQIAHLELIVKALPELHIHIAAVTEMSTKLTQFERYRNVALYPNANLDKIRSLYERCSYYLDINDGNEIHNAVRSAYDYNHVIFGYQEVAHNQRFTAPAHLYRKDAIEQLIGDLRNAMADPVTYEDCLKAQRKAANEVTPQMFVASMD
ncbi:accessory Sec system glycosylation chaperone GtfB [Macrococcus capreoli]|uniref:accessory Sec system glycosylation chaperone GtfB n=1 Tax=Macrococcus capreoli TaxID=2982690 RepID=UPI0021D5C1AB|nr:accessory Sec system glycosylation chaperone GtfB [Macrococcus sp. TMW 2.2395]MCU7558144.1 accessory Sec system glycosylation chaperone GtfB [Macrococcus sp. TMW 2.2395]